VEGQVESGAFGEAIPSSPPKTWPVILFAFILYDLLSRGVFSGFAGLLRSQRQKLWLTMTPEFSHPAKPSITFLVPAARPGTNGVGDYALQLAAALLKGGTAASVLAWCEPTVEVVEESEIPYSGSTVPTFFLPAKLSRKVRRASAYGWLERQECTHLSLQFSGYGFHPQGLAFGIASDTRRILTHYRTVHLYFHEIWIGLEEGSSWKHRLAGFLQMLSIQRMVRQLRPVCLHTNNPVYVRALRKAGLAATHLPLAATIPVCHTLTSEASAPFKKSEKGQPLVVCMFGSIQPNLDTALVAQGLKGLCKLTASSLEVHHLGRLDAGGQSRWKSLCETVRKHQIPCTTKAHGAVEPDQISARLHTADLALSATPLALVAKSSAVAAFREHDLPVWVAARPWQTRPGVLAKALSAEGQTSDPRILPPESTPEDLLQALRAPRTPFPNGPERLARAFLQDVFREMADRSEKRQ
jgi:hypothetical protein